MRNTNGRFTAGNSGRPQGSSNKNSATKYLNRYKAYDGKNVVYIIRAIGTDIYKIGRSRKLHKRLRDINSMCPYKLSCVHLIELDTWDLAMKVEKGLHKAFKHKNLKLEWFILTEDSISLIKEIKSEEDILIIRKKLLGILSL